MIPNELLKSLGFVKAVYKTGSQILPWINNPNDSDYLFLIDENCSNFSLADLYKYKPFGETWVCTKKSDLSCGTVSYNCYFCELIYGENAGKVYNIFENMVDYKWELVRFGLNADYEKTKKYKFWYHILTGIYLLRNGKYELTDEQIANVRLCHDKQMTREIYDYIQGMLLEYKVQLRL